MQVPHATSSPNPRDQDDPALPISANRETAILKDWRQEWENDPDDSFLSLGNSMSHLNRPMSDNQIGKLPINGSTFGANLQMKGSQARQPRERDPSWAARANAHHDEHSHAPAMQGTRRIKRAYDLINLSDQYVPLAVVLQALQRAYRTGYEDRRTEEAAEEASSNSTIDGIASENPIVRPQSPSSSPVFYPISPELL
ncbi:hypothetical protein NX059_002734 [Plenodomus lindquistii]|nr:hypothetical protein NX059_002734 [Plenodomus lindquistii]